MRLIDQALEEYSKLKELVKAEGESSDSATLLRSIDQKIEWLKENPLRGEVVKKKDIPKKNWTQTICSSLGLQDIGECFIPSEGKK